MRIFLIPGFVVFVWVYFFAAVHSVGQLKIGIFLAGLFLNAVFSFWGNYLPRMYPTHLRGTGESFSLNIGARLLGPFAVIGTTQLVNVMPGSAPAVRLAYSAGIIAVLAYSASLIGSLWLSEPEHAQLPE